MSGICGIINFSQQPVEKLTIQAMAAAAAYRGRDGLEFICKDYVGLGHLALHITPESVGEIQPLGSTDGNILLTADVRIDNREELTNVLTTKGFCQNPNPTDAELILAAYQCWGTNCPGYLLGDFAFAIWDSRHQHAFLARDPMAMRPLYYQIESQRLLFASEIKQILAVPGVPRAIFEPAVATYLANLHEPLEWTLYQGILQLIPGEALLVSSQQKRTWRYWDIDPEYQIRYRDESEYIEHFLEIFEDAVRCRLRTVKPVGIFLSGGMDSGSIASIAGYLLKKGERLCPEFRTYSFAFENLPQCDERHISSKIVDDFNFEATDILADDAWPLSNYPKHSPDSDHPFIGVYQPLLEKTMAIARVHGVGLLTSGDRGDLMMGEPIYDYLSLLWSGHWQTLLKELRMQSRWRSASLGRIARTYLLQPIKNSIKLWPGIKQFYQGIYLAKSPLKYPEWISADFAKRVELEQIMHDLRLNDLTIPIRGHAAKQRYQSIFTPMHMQGMVWSNRTQAKFGLDFADPWSDRRIASFAMAVPQRVLNTTEESKRLVRAAMKGIMPESARELVCKIYPSPLYHQAIQTKAKTTLLEIIKGSQSTQKGYLQGDMLMNAYRAFAEQGNESIGFWEAITLEMWLRQYWS